MAYDNASAMFLTFIFANIFLLHAFIVSTDLHSRSEISFMVYPCVESISTSRSVSLSAIPAFFIHLCLSRLYSYSADFNQCLSYKHADVVKKTLVNKYHISSDRLISKGKGATEKLFEQVEFNRVAVFNSNAK